MCLGVPLVWLSLCWPALSADDAFVTPPIELEAAKFVPADLMTGNTYRVRPTAVNDGFVNSYTLETQWGELKAVSDYRLRARIQETQALKALDEMSRAGIFGDALLDGALAPVETVRRPGHRAGRNGERRGRGRGQLVRQRRQRRDQRRSASGRRAFGGRWLGRHETRLRGRVGRRSLYRLAAPRGGPGVGRPGGLCRRHHGQSRHGQGKPKARCCKRRSWC